MSQTRNVFVETLPATGNFNFNGKITNFSCDSLVFTLSGAAAVSDADLSKIVIRAQLKNSKGSNAIVINSVPARILAKLSDYLGGWGVNGSDKYGAFAVDLGNIVLEGDDELDVIVNGTGLSQAYDLSVFGYDTKIGAEKIYLYDFVKGSPTQTYQQVDAMAAYLSLPDDQVASDSNSIAVTDYFGRNIITENEAVGLGAVMAQSGDCDNFGLIWSDDTGLTQDMSFKVAAEGEDFLVVRRFFDINRLGMGQQGVIDFSDYLAFIQRTNSVKYRCLQYAAKLDQTI